MVHKAGIEAVVCLHKTNTFHHCCPSNIINSFVNSFVNCAHSSFIALLNSQIYSFLESEQSLAFIFFAQSAIVFWWFALLDQFHFSKLSATNFARSRLSLCQW
jgi:hypothetical protein